MPSLPPPLLLPPAPKTNKSNELNLSLNYSPPKWSSIPPIANGENVLDEEGFCSHYFLEVIKSGSVVDKIKLSKEFISFGRLDMCDILCEHPSLSRFHAILQYSNGDEDKNYPEGKHYLLLTIQFKRIFIVILKNFKGYYVFDLGSTHGTFVNKLRIEPNKYVPVNVDSMIKFGLSTRIYLLHGPKSKNSSEDLKINLTHEQMRRIKDKYDQISIKLKVRKEIEEEETQDEGENPFAVIEEEDESFYSADPRKALKHLYISFK